MNELDIFTINVNTDQYPVTAEIKPCCKEDNVFYYDVFIGGEYQFTITHDDANQNGENWKVSMINADNQVDPSLVNALGKGIESFYAS